MKKQTFPSLRLVSVLVTALTFGAAVAATAQTDPTMPVVTIHAVDPNASETAPSTWVDPGRFLLRRDGPTNLALNVYCVLDGTASNGVDYATIPNWISVPAGVREVPIPVKPIDDALVEGPETVVLQLVYSPLRPPINYTIGSPSSAVVTIADNEPPPTNKPPTVGIATPADGAKFTAPANILICADARDTDGYVATVEFFADNISLGIRTNLCPLCVGPLNPFCLTWSNVPPGEYVLTAKATDDDGAMRGSDPVRILVRSEPLLPVVTIRAVNPNACEPGVLGCLVPVFVVTRTGSTNDPMTVFYSIRGTASNGVDYAPISNTVVIPPGRWSAEIVINPLPDTLAEGTETVVLRLEDVACIDIYPPPPGCYQVGTPREAVVYISDNDPPPQPVVTIVATDSIATEIPLVPPGMGMPQRIDTGEFTVSRTGSTTLPLNVYYRVSGTASNGVDYERLSGTVTIPAGEASATVYVMPIDDLLVEGTETVVVTLSPIACIAIYPPPPECYVVGTPREAVVCIADNDQSANFPPDVKSTKPLDGQTFVTPVNVPIRAETKDRDGYVDHVEFYAGANQIGEQTRYYLTPPPPGQLAVFEMVWTNPPVGRHELRVKARDDQGAIGWSLPVTIWVVNTNLPPPPPVVTITAPDPIASEGTNCYQIMIYPPPTNNPCVSNTATFVVRRSGPTNDALTVHYRIGGTASNGVDYVELPGLVTIPAGKRAVEFKLVPIDDALRERVETVVLGLRVPPDLANNVPPYHVGYPGRAAAIIVDNDLPRPETGPLPDRCFHVMKPGANGTWWRIECSTDMTQWTPVCTLPVMDGAIDFVDPDADELPARFYRAVPETTPLME